MNIKVNGKDLQVEDNINITKLLETIEYKGKMFVVEKNEEIIYKEQYETTSLIDGDSIEIVGFAGGG